VKKEKKKEKREKEKVLYLDDNDPLQSLQQ